MVWRCRAPFPARPGRTRTTSRRQQDRNEVCCRYSSNSSSPRAGFGEPEDAGPESADWVRSLYTPTSFREGEKGGIRHRIHRNGPPRATRVPSWQCLAQNAGVSVCGRPSICPPTWSAAGETSDSFVGTSRLENCFVRFKPRAPPAGTEDGNHGIRALGVRPRLDLSGPAVERLFEWLYRDCWANIHPVRIASLQAAKQGTRQVPGPLLACQCRVSCRPS